MDELLRIRCLAGLTSNIVEEPKQKQSLMEALDEVIKAEKIKSDVVISTGNKLLKELALHTVQPIKKSSKQTVMESSATLSLKDKETLIKLISESIKYKNKDSIKSQIATKIINMMEKYGFTSPSDLIIHFGGTVIMNKNGNSIQWS
jgi:hypothetical protein